MDNLADGVTSTSYRNRRLGGYDYDRNRVRPQYREVDGPAPTSAGAGSGLAEPDVEPEFEGDDPIRGLDSDGRPNMETLEIL